MKLMTFALIVISYLHSAQNLCPKFSEVTSNMDLINLVSLFMSDIKFFMFSYVINLPGEFYR